MMFRLTCSAVAEGAAAWEWFYRRDPDVAQKFEARIATALELLLNFPRAGSAIEGGHRKVSLAPFEFAIVYRLRGEEILVVGVVHLRSDNRLLW
jgi:plasmid stabilization system protein ParE